MGRTLSALLVGGVLGIALGYALFGEIAGVRLGLSDLLPTIGTGLEAGLRRGIKNVAGIDEIRRNILLTGGAGAILGVVSTRFRRRRK